MVEEVLGARRPGHARRQRGAQDARPFPDLQRRRLSRSEADSALCSVEASRCLNVRLNARLAHTTGRRHIRGRLREIGYSSHDCRLNGMMKHVTLAGLNSVLRVRQRFGQTIRLCFVVDDAIL